MEKAAAVYPPLETETRETIPNARAAYHVGLKEKTLRDRWAGQGKGPIKPVRVGGRIHWKTADLRRLLKLEGA